MATGQPFSIVAQAPVDAMQEFKGTVSGFTTDSGPGGGGQFNLVTRSGTNHFHGVLFEYNRNAALVANSWFGNNSHIAKPNYIRNQFGGNIGGPMLPHDKAFFFFDFYDSRIVQSALVNRTVPLDNFRDGNIGYILNAPGCSRTSRQNTQPQCIGFYTPAQVKALDPAGIGNSAPFFNLVNTRYPHVNNAAGGGDGVNTGFYTFTTPEPDNEQNYAVKLDFNLTSKHRLFAVGTLNRRDSTQQAPEFPQDGTIAPFHDRSFRWSVGDNWAISNNMANSLAVGETVSSYQFPITNLNPNGTNLLRFNGGVTSLMSNAWLSAINAQGRRIPIPQISDNLQWLKHSHSLQFGGFFKYINSADHTILDYNEGGYRSWRTDARPQLQPAAFQHPLYLRYGDQRLGHGLCRCARPRWPDRPAVQLRRLRKSFSARYRRPASLPLLPVGALRRRYLEGHALAHPLLRRQLAILLRSLRDQGS